MLCSRRQLYCPPYQVYTPGHHDSTKHGRMLPVIEVRRYELALLVVKCPAHVIVSGSDDVCRCKSKSLSLNAHTAGMIRTSKRHHFSVTTARSFNAHAKCKW